MKTKSNDTVKKLVELNKIIKALDPAIKQQAFDLLRPIFIDNAPVPSEHPQREHHKVHTHTPDHQSKEDFFGSFNHKKPSDNVFLVAAWLYSQHGSIPLSSDMIRAVAGEVGLTVPGRPDMTLKSAQKKGKRLFTQQGLGYKPTVHGEALLKEAYKVKKGNLPYKEEVEN